MSCLLFEVLSLQNLLITIFIIFSEYNTNLSPGEGGHREFGLKVKGVRSITPPIATMPRGRQYRKPPEAVSPACARRERARGYLVAWEPVLRGVDGSDA